MTIIVTGGAGFIGGNYIHYHMKEHPEDRVVCIDTVSYTHLTLPTNSRV